MAGAEALLRWFHPQRGQIPTGDFVAVAKETGLIGLGHNLDLKIVAEGAESLERLQFLRGERCDLVRGFLMSRALPEPRASWS